MNVTGRGLPLLLHREPERGGIRRLVRVILSQVRTAEARAGMAVVTAIGVGCLLLCPFSARPVTAKEHTASCPELGGMIGRVRASLEAAAGQRLRGSSLGAYQVLLSTVGSMVRDSAGRSLRRARSDPDLGAAARGPLVDRARRQHRARRRARRRALAGDRGPPAVRRRRRPRSRWWRRRSATSSPRAGRRGGALRAGLSRPVQAHAAAGWAAPEPARARERPPGRPRRPPALPARAAAARQRLGRPTWRTRSTRSASTSPTR